MSRKIRFIYFIPVVLLIGSLYIINSDLALFQPLLIIYNSISCISLALLGIFLFLKPLMYIKHTGLWDHDEITSTKILSIRLSGILCIVVSLFCWYLLI